MTTTEPDAAPALTEAEKITAAGALGQLLALSSLPHLPSTGPIRGGVDGSVVVDCSGEQVILERPTFGQIKKIIRAGSRLDDRLAALNFEAKANLTKTNAEWSALPGATVDGDGRPTVDVTDEILPALISLRDASRSRADEVEDRQFEAVAHFWTAVFGTILGEDHIPAEDTWPSEIVDLGLHRKVIDHWRLVPVGPG